MTLILDKVDQLIARIMSNYVCESKTDETYLLHSFITFPNKVEVSGFVKLFWVFVPSLPKEIFWVLFVKYLHLLGG